MGGLHIYKRMFNLAGYLWKQIQGYLPICSLERLFLWSPHEPQHPCSFIAPYQEEYIIVNAVILFKMVKVINLRIALCKYLFFDPYWDSWINFWTFQGMVKIPLVVISMIITSLTGKILYFFENYREHLSILCFSNGTDWN